LISINNWRQILKIRCLFIIVFILIFFRLFLKASSSALLFLPGVVLLLIFSKSDYENRIVTCLEIGAKFELNDSN